MKIDIIISKYIVGGGNIKRYKLILGCSVIFCLVVGFSIAFFTDEKKNDVNAIIDKEQHAKMIEEGNEVLAKIEDSEFIETVERELIAKGYKYRGSILLVHTKDDKELEVRIQFNPDTDIIKSSNEINKIIKQIAEDKSIGSISVKIT